MRGFLIAAGAAAFGVLALFGLALVIAIGGFAATHYDAAAQACPHGTDCPCPQCLGPFAPASPVMPMQPNCPDGRCPLPNGSIEVGAPRNGDVNAAALEETKNQTGCVPCQRRPIALRPVVLQPAQVQPTASVSSADTPRTGAFQCDRCKQPTVGEDWQEIWADDDTPLTCLCRDCWASMSPTQRTESLKAFATRSQLNKSQTFYARAAIEEHAKH
jgi:hypothetical protein